MKCYHKYNERIDKWIVYGITKDNPLAQKISVHITESGAIDALAIYTESNRIKPFSDVIDRFKDTMIEDDNNEN